MRVEVVVHWVTLDHRLQGSDGMEGGWQHNLQAAGRIGGQQLPCFHWEIRPEGSLREEESHWDGLRGGSPLDAGRGGRPLGNYHP